MIRHNAHVTAALDTLTPDFLARYLPTYALELESFIAAVASGAPVTPDFESGRRALALADAALASSKRGERVIVNLDRIRGAGFLDVI